MLTRARHWSLPWARCIQFTSAHPLSPRSIIILFSYLRLGLPSGLFPSGFPTKILYALLISPLPVTWLTYLVKIHKHTHTHTHTQNSGQTAGSLFKCYLQLNEPLCQWRAYKFVGYCPVNPHFFFWPPAPHFGINNNSVLILTMTTPARRAN
jgi:hypothetical protein